MITNKKKWNDYWLDRLAKPLPVLDMSTDFPRPSLFESKWESVEIPVDQRVREAVMTLCAEQERDAESMLLTAYAVLLFRLTHNEELLLGAPSPSPSPSHAQTSILPLRLSLEDVHTFEEVYQLVKEQLEEARHYAEVPYAWFVENMWNDREESRPAGFPVIFHAIEGPRVSAEEYSSEMIWSLRTDEAEWKWQIHYHPSLYRKDSLLHMETLYMTILQAMLNDGSRSFRTLSILTLEDQRVYDKLNRTQFDFPADKTIPQMFQEAAKAYPSHWAVSMSGRRMTYQELDTRTNQVACMLMAAGLKKGEYVSVFMNRSIETIIGILAILKAGGVYIPVDPEYPQERIQYMFTDSGSPYILTTKEHEETARKLASRVATTVLRVDTSLEPYSVEDVRVDFQATDLAYIIYTSGSTGRPKGTLLEHRGVINLIHWLRDFNEITPSDVLFEFASFSFDASLIETFGALLWGARLHILSNEEKMSFSEFACTVEREQGTIVTLPTSYFRQMASLMEEQDYQRLSTMRKIMVGGEALSGETVRQWHRRFGTDIQITNGYGPTECTVATTAYAITSEFPAEQANVPIGKPLYNFELYVVSPDGQICPVNVPGELYIGSVGMAKGYLHQPEKTEAAFVPHLFDSHGEKRLYRSGDIVRLLADGNMEYLGRKDAQVKVRGYRVEIGEIEDTLERHPSIGEVAVLAVTDKLGNSTLKGYYTTHPNEVLPTAQVREYLASQVPDYMIPEILIELGEMPLTPNDKIDRTALSKREERRMGATEYQPPRTVQQKWVAQIWEQVLHAGPISIQDDFFDLGGSSLKALEAVARLKSQYPFVSVQDFYLYRTIEAMSEYLVTKSMSDVHTEEVVKDEVRVLQESPLVTGAEPVLNADGYLKKVVLTGATGFLGAHVLHDLVMGWDAEVYCLVRPHHDMPGRIFQTMSHYFGEHKASVMMNRIQIIPADLAVPGLGISHADRDELLTNMDTIIHTAADVRHFGDPERFYRVNALATKDLLDLAKAKPGVRFHHVSTISVCQDLAATQWDHVQQHGDYDFDTSLTNVYSNSKLQAERFVREAIQAGLPATIYRPGNLVGHSVTGIFQPNMDSNAFYRMMKLKLFLGIAPDVNMPVDLTPIDFASRALLALANQPDTVGRTFHLVNPISIDYSAFIKMLVQLGYPINLISQDNYQDWLSSHILNRTDEMATLAVSQLEGEGAIDSPYQFGSRETTRFLEHTTVRCPVPNPRWLEKMVAHAVTIGYFPAPPEGQLASGL